jgi:hypothetical protein
LAANLGTGKNKEKSGETREELLFKYMQTLIKRKFDGAMDQQIIIKTAVSELQKELKKNGKSTAVYLQCPKCGCDIHIANK